VSRMNRSLLTAGALLMLVSSAAMAFNPFPNPVRVYTLSGGDSFNNNFILDSNDAYSWFGRIYRNADHVRVTWAPYGEAQGLGFIKSEEGYGAYMLHFQEGYNYFGRQEGEYNHFTIGYGYPFGNFDLGLVYNRQGLSWNEEDDPETRVEGSESYNTIGAGITYDMDDETAVDVSFMFMSGSEDDGVDEDPETDFETTGFGIGARAFKSMREDLTIIPVVLFSSYTDSWGDDEEEKGTSMAAGLAFDYTINEDNDLYLFVNYQNDKYEYTYMVADEEFTEEDTYTAMPGIGAAVEHELTDLFTIRMGATKNWTKYKTDDGDTVDEYKYYPWQFTFGMGIAMGDWVIDLQLNQDWMYTAGYWFHGVDNYSSQPPVAQIEAKLWF
jgi:hypothetical protein